MTNIVFDSRWQGPHGIGRFAAEMSRRIKCLQAIDAGGSPTNPLDCFKLSWKLWRQSAAGFFSPGFNAPWWSVCPFVFTIHDLIHVNYPEETSAAKRLYYQRVARPAARRAYRVLTVSEYSKQEIVAWAGVNPDRVEVVYNGVGEAFKPGGSAREPGYRYLLYVGNQRAHKNVNSLIEALQLVRHDFDVRLLLTGTAESATQRKIEEFDLHDRVEFLGKLSDAELAEAYRGAATVVLPSHYEGFGLPVVEAMACGTPVICSNRTSLPEVAGGAALLTETTAESIAEGIRQCLADDNLRADLRERGLRQSAKFTWRESAATIERVLRNMLADTISVPKATSTEALNTSPE